MCVKFGSCPERKKLFSLSDDLADLVTLRKGLLTQLKLDPKLLVNVGGNQFTTEQDLILYRNHEIFGEVEMENDCILSDNEFVTMKVQVLHSQGKQFTALLLISSFIDSHFSFRSHSWT